MLGMRYKSPSNAYDLTTANALHNFSDIGVTMRYSWRAEYHNGPTVFRTDNVAYHQVIKPGLKSFSLYSIADLSNVFTQHLLIGDKLFYRLRSAVNDTGIIERIHIVGLVRHDIRYVTFIYEEDHKIIFGD